MATIRQSSDKAAILGYIIETLTAITADWDVGEISSETKLGGLGLESISYVYLIAEIQQYYGLKDQLIAQLRVRGTPLKDLRAADLAEMVYQIQNAPAVHESAQGAHS